MEITEVGTCHRRKNKIVLIICDGNRDIKYLMRMNSPLKDLVRVYCAKWCVDIASVQFIWKAQRIAGDKTPADLGMANGNYIDVIHTSR